MNQKALDNQILKHDHSFNAQFTKTGQRPQNFIKNVDPSIRYNKYPRLSQLMEEKSSFIKRRNHPPVYIKENLQTFPIQTLGKFDVIVVDPPWEQYQKRAKRLNIYNDKQQYYKSWSLQQLLNLKVGQISENLSFIFLWVGSEHLQDGRQLFKQWGFRRCQDIVWVKTNIVRKTNISQSQEGVFIRVKQHCLMGYKGQPKKVSDHNFIHPNIDIDVVITQQPQSGSLQKPTQVYDIIQRFCLGRKKIQLFGLTNNIRNGWLTIGSMLTQSKFQLSQYNSWFKEQKNSNLGFIGGRYMGTTPTIQSLRPRQDMNQIQISSSKIIQEDGKRSSAKSDISKN